MSTDHSLQFLLFAAVAGLLFHAMPGRLRASVLFPAANILFVCLVLRRFPPLFLLAGFIAAGYLVTLVAEQRRRAGLVAATGLFLLLFFYVKDYQVLSFLPRPERVVATVGLSYILIRCLQVVFDVYEGTLPSRPPLGRFINFLVAWPMFLSGPIQNYQSFSAQLDSLPERTLDADALYQALYRIVRGVFWIAVLGNAASALHEGLRDALPETNAANMAALGYYAAHVALTAVAYLAFLYFNFSGYTDLAIGAGRLVGLTVPENFNQPWRAVNFMDLWARWHMTLSNWFRTYVFNSILRSLAARFPSPRGTPYLGVVAIFITFFLVGVWHGPTAPFLICGVMLGVGVSANMLWQIRARAVLGRERYKALSTNSLYRLISSAAGIAYLALSIVPFWRNVAQLKQLHELLGLAGELGTLAVATAVLAPVLALLPAAGSALRRVTVNGGSPAAAGVMLTALFYHYALVPKVELAFVYQTF